ncbi:ACT domain-containing protein [Peribacillus acanthi]|uniref:ACT domain-containing protein n=1 Tax=Peribacillus acanthi TaxID=2171554 RepID=UPI000D3E12D4|nr:ACT domain-containing protein [Peribacillus acanthi]
MNQSLITNIDLESNIIQVKLENNGYKEKFLVTLLNLFTQSNISIDFVTSTSDTVLFTLKNEIAEEAVGIMHENGYKPEITSNCTKITIDGTAEITGVPGIVSKVITALSNKNIKVLQFADNHNTMWVLIESKNKEEAFKAIYCAFD